MKAPPMKHAMAAPLAPFVDALPLPSRLIAVQHDGRLTVGIRAGTHRFQRDLPVSSIWGFEGTVPGPTIEAERTVEWRNELEGPFSVLDTFLPSRRTPTGCRCSACPADLEPGTELTLLNTAPAPFDGSSFRVNPNEIIQIAVRFTTYSGRYKYHCHILEHEDRDMMRPFVTMAPELMPFMA